MKRFATLLLCVACSALLSIAQAHTDRLRSAADSISTRLASTTAPAERLRLLLDLADVELILDNDYSGMRRVWDEATAQHHTEATLEAGKSITLRYINRGVLDSADLWIARCEEQFEGACALPTLTYLKMMREIRDLKEVAKVADKLVAQNVTLRDGKQPYEQMKTLFLLGIIASNEKFQKSDNAEVRSSQSYLEEGLAIAKSLPLKEAYSFHLQFLVALGGSDPQYAEQIIALRNDYLALEKEHPRPFHSRRPEIMAYARLLRNGDIIGREKLEESFRQFNRLTTEFPYDSPTPLDFYYYKVVVPYYQFTKNYQQVIICCDSAMRNAPKYKMGGWQFYQPRIEALARLGKFEQAFDSSQRYIQVKDSLNAANATQQLMELQTQYDVDRLKFENKAQWIQLIAICGICAALLILAGSLVWYARTLRRKNRSLCRQIDQSTRTFKELQQIRHEVTIRPGIESNEPTLFERIAQHLSQCEVYADPTMNREKVAAALNTNTTYLSQAIQEVCGNSFGEYLTFVRMQHAVELMQEQPDLSLDEVSIRSGYGSYSGFYAAFRKQYNLSPRKYIEYLQQNTGITLK